MTTIETRPAGCPGAAQDAAEPSQAPNLHETAQTPPGRDTGRRYMVIRGDDNGQHFIVRDGMDDPEAQALYRRLLRGHKQWYAVLCYDTPGRRAVLVETYGLRDMGARDGVAAGTITR